MKANITQSFKLVVSAANSRVEVISNRIYECGQNRSLTKALKTGSTDAIAEAAKSMQSLLPYWDNVAVVPVPSHNGYPTYMLQVARKLGGHVYNILRCAPHEQLYISKKRGAKPKAEDLGFYTIGSIPSNMFVVFIDNVVATGATALAARMAVGRGTMLAFSISKRGMR